jgi:hypothetical protein
MGGVARQLALGGAVALAVLVVFSAPAYAYIDPGTGSYLLQLLVAGALGASVALRIYWNQLKKGWGRLWGRSRRKPLEEGDARDE